MILAALDAAGGRQYLERQAEANPVAFLTLIGKALSLPTNATVKREPRDLTDAELIDNGIEGERRGLSDKLGLTPREMSGPELHLRNIMKN
jgi:hypothetical protein